MALARSSLSYAVFCVFMLVACEVGLRLYGYTPQSDEETIGLSNWYAHDLDTGWRFTPGRYVNINPITRKPYNLTIWSNGSRATGPVEPISGQKDRPELVFLGDSFTASGGLSDEDSFAWLVQAGLPNMEVWNLGTFGWGGCQSLQRMKQHLKLDSSRIVHFVFGFSEFTEDRNVANPLYAWRIARNSKSRTSFMPYCGVSGDGTIAFFPPESFELASLPLLDSSSIFHLLSETYYAVISQSRTRDKRLVTEKILLEMNSLARAHNSDFTVMLQRFNPENRAHYARFLETHHIPFIDGTHPEQYEPTMKIYDGHPNETLNRIWAERILQFFKRE